MKNIYGSSDMLMIGHLKNLLENQGISCIIKNELTSNLRGKLPITEVTPEIWILDDSQFHKADKIIKDAFSSEKNQTTVSWKCFGCGEAIESQFSECWNCGKSKLSNKKT